MSRDRPTPVLVYIHGGGFQRGSGDISEVMPDAIVKQNLVLVTINYRLDIFGKYVSRVHSLIYADRVQVYHVPDTLDWFQNV